MFSGDVLEPVVSALQNAVKVTDIIDLFSSGIAVALPLILTWFRCKMVLPQICECREAVGRG